MRQLALLLLLALALVVLYRSPYLASNMETFPDSAEYATMASRAVREGRITLNIEGRELPARYQPWFSLLLLAPTYIMNNAEPGAAIFAITAMALLGVAVAFRLGSDLGGLVGGLAAGALVLFQPDFVNWGRKIMSDVPAAAIAMAVVAVFVRDRRTEKASWFWHWTAAMLLIIVALIRPAYVLFTLPFVWVAVQSRRWNQAVFYLACGLSAVVLMALYNSFVFGSFALSGYQFWCYSSYGSGANTFSLRNLSANLFVLLSGPSILMWIAASAPFALSHVRKEWRTSSQKRRLLVFLLVAGCPFAVLHLLYSYPGSRFFLPLNLFLGIVAGIHAGSLMPKSTMKPAVALTAAILATVLTYRLFIYQPTPPRRRLAADSIEANTPANAVIISAIDPVYLRLMLGTADTRRIIPLSRKVEYASKNILVLKQRLHAQEEAVKFVATDRTDELADLVRNDIPVFLETQMVDDYTT